MRFWHVTSYDCAKNFSSKFHRSPRLSLRSCFKILYTLWRHNINEKVLLRLIYWYISPKIPCHQVHNDSQCRIYFHFIRKEMKIVDKPIKFSHISWMNIRNIKCCYNSYFMWRTIYNKINDARIIAIESNEKICKGCDQQIISYNPFSLSNKMNVWNDHGWPFKSLLVLLFFD